MAKESVKETKAVGAEGKKEEVLRELMTKKESAVMQETVYSAAELASNARKIFGTRQECVAAALRAAGKMECTVPEAQEIVRKFLKREVV